MKILKTRADWLAVCPPEKIGSLGLVPTMGALHVGHASLFARSVRENDVTVATVFVNPTQFNDPNDLATYPVTLADDFALLEREGVDYAFVPSYQELYPDGYRYRVCEDSFSRELCGASRPGHFDGVLSVVLKLLNIFRPTRAYFGEKDYQQYLLIRDMATAFFLGTEIVPCPLVRESSGLAMSSRNRRLSPAALAKAPLFYRSLSSGKEIGDIRDELSANGFSVDYVEELDGRLFGAVFLEGVRLIDNVAR